MRSPKDLQDHATKYLRNHFTQALSAPGSLRLDWPLHPPTAAAAARDIDATKGFIRAWQRWPHQDELVYASRNWSRAGLGTNNVPARITIKGAERIAAAAGLTAAYTRALERAQSIAAIFPDSPDFADTVRRAYTQWKDSSSYLSLIHI